ncbi:MAG TPA: CBS domain-containing protein [Vicinamibacteria bacterium]|nr:CBS domain-containing protein [Vicinamibacteria bacterium]
MESRCPECGAGLPRGVPAWVRHLKVADAMTVAPVTIGPEDSLMQAVEVMRKSGIRRLPVVVAETLVGILAQGDLNRAQPSALSETQDEFVRVMDGTPVSRIMIQNPVTISEEASLAEAAQTLHAMKFGALPVTRDGRLVGILTDSDLLRCLVDLFAHGG